MGFWVYRGFSLLYSPVIDQRAGRPVCLVKYLGHELSKGAIFIKSLFLGDWWGTQLLMLCEERQKQKVAHPCISWHASLRLPACVWGKQKSTRKTYTRSRVGGDSDIIRTPNYPVLLSTLSTWTIASCRTQCGLTRREKHRAERTASECTVVLNLAVWQQCIYNTCPTDDNRFKEPQVMRRPFQNAKYRLNYWNCRATIWKVLLLLYARPVSIGQITQTNSYLRCTPSIVRVFQKNSYDIQALWVTGCSSSISWRHLLCKIVHEQRMFVRYRAYWILY